MLSNKIIQDAIRTVKEGKNQYNKKPKNRVIKPATNIIFAACSFANFHISGLAIALFELYPLPKPIFSGGYFEITKAIKEKNKPTDMAVKKSIVL